MTEILLRDVQVNMNSFNLTVIVLDPGIIRQTNNNSSINVMRVADDSGSMTLTVFKPEYPKPFAPGDILKVRNAYSGVHQGKLGVLCHRNGECKKSGEFLMTFSETPNLSDQPLPTGYVDNSQHRKDGKGTYNCSPKQVL